MTTSLDMIRGRSNVVTLTNNSGGGLVAGDVCIQDTSADEKVTTTTSAASVLKVFVAAETIANGAAGKFYESGYCPLVNVNASVTRGRFLFTHTVAKQAAESATYGAGAFGKILKSGTTPSAIIYSATAQAAGSIGGATGSTDNAIIRADGTGGATVQSSAATIDDNGTVNIPTGQTYNINNSPHTHAGGGFTTGAHVYNSGNISANDSTPTTLTFDSERYDTDTIHDTGSNTGRLTCNTAGKYLIVAQAAYAANATGLRAISILLNVGGTIIASASAPGTSLIDLRLIATTIYDLSGGDYVYVSAYQTSGGPLNVINGANYTPEFMMQRIG